MLRFVLHYGFHFVVPLGIAWFFFRSNWKHTYLIFLAAMLIDLDHLLVNPVFDPNRCSIGFHPLHSYYAIGAYILLLLPKKTRVLGLALLLHILADQIDCLMI